MAARGAVGLDVPVHRVVDDHPSPPRLIRARSRHFQRAASAATPRVLHSGGSPCTGGGPRR